jgi:hypothetical protein
LGPGHPGTGPAKTIRPEGVKPQLLSQLTGQPAVPECARPTQLHLGKLDLYRINVTFCDHGVIGEQARLLVFPTVLVKNLQGFTPAPFLRCGYFTEIQDGPLNGFAMGDSAIFHDTEIFVPFAVFPAFITS